MQGKITDINRIKGSIRACSLLAWIAVMAATAGPGAESPTRIDPATLVLHNGKIVTVEASRPEAQALAVRGDIIVAVGAETDIKPYIGAGTTVIDLKGALAVPGLIESHAHFLSIGDSKLNLELLSTTSWQQIVALVGEAAKKAKPGDWIVGHGWHQEKWTSRPTPNVEGFPTHESLDAVSPNNPVLLTHASGHATFANARAMELAGVTKATPNPPGGEILKDSKDNPTGIFRETASNLIARARISSRAKLTPSDQAAEFRRIVALADKECLKKGITTVHDAGETFDTIDHLKQIAREGKLGVRLYIMVGDSNERLARDLAKYRVVGFGGNHLTVRAVKAGMDGALGSRGAWLLAPYTDLPGHIGLNTTPIKSLKETARIAMANDCQLSIHAIGDRANREVLNIYEEIFKANPDKKDLRWRDEHAQHLNAADIDRFGKLGVIAAMQGIHCTSDAPYVLARLGAARAEEGAYVWQKLIKSGATIANGTDAPIEDVDPIPNYYATVTRKLKNGAVFYGDQKMSRLEGLKSYTVNGAYASFEEQIKGSLKPGKLGDITVLSKDILTIPDDQILSTKVLYTIIGGRIVYAAK
jgi:predicted amidohydrolase YtcJ